MPEIESLRLELGAASRDTTPAPLLPIASTHGIPQTPTQKVKLFQSLFRGRTDVFPTRFISRKTGKAGYAAACANKFKPGICGLRTGGKCGDCSNQAWFFFTAAVPARIAREMACYLITDTMSRRHELRMSSYDRLFPNQDTMPRGGFGNLIALPLQREPREHGNTMFVDEHFEPFSDQWAFLGSLQRVEPQALEGIAQ